MKKKKTRLRGRMLTGLLIMLVPLLLVVNLMFYNVMQQEREKAQSNLRILADTVSSSVAEIARQAYSASDAFAEDQFVTQYIDQVYDDALMKRAVTIMVRDRYLERYNQTILGRKIDAILVNSTGEVYDFLDPLQESSVILQGIQKLEMNHPQRIGRFTWYPLTENFLKKEKIGNVRDDTVVFGSRRIFSYLKYGYPYLHIFAIRERELYEQYASLSGQPGVTVYILDRAGGLISSSSEQAVAARCAPEELVQLHLQEEEPEGQHRIQGKDCFTARKTDPVSGWTAWILLPDANVVEASKALHFKIVLLFLFCIAASGTAMLLQYRRYMMPIARMAESIRAVDMGNLHAYAEPCGEQEMHNMMGLYNLMLKDMEYNMDRQIQAERNIKDLELQALSAQVNPHFLYNTLETIVWKANEAGRPDIGKIASSLGKLYRLAIQGGALVPLPQELEHLKAYVAIQSSRHGDKAQCTIRCRNIDTGKYMVLKLMLQPVVENCYLYAGEEKKGMLRIRVDICTQEGSIVIRVTDNGIGMEKQTLEKVRHQMITGESIREEEKARRSSGIGLHNVYARLRIYQKDSTMTIWSRKGLGTVVQITIPEDNALFPGSG